MERQIEPARLSVDKQARAMESKVVVRRSAERAGATFPADAVVRFGYDDCYFDVQMVDGKLIVRKFDHNADDGLYVKPMVSNQITVG